MPAFSSRRSSSSCRCFACFFISLALSESAPPLWFFTDFCTLLTNCCTLADLFLFFRPNVDSSIIFSFFAFTAFLLGVCSLGGMAVYLRQI